MKRIAIYAASVASVLLVWELVSSTFFTPALFPGPLAVARKAVALIEEGQLQKDVLASLGRVLAGFTIGSLVGIAVGFVIGASSLVRIFLDPYVHFLRFITPIAWISPVMIWFGIGETSKVILITYTTTFAVMLSTSLGITQVPRNRIRAAQACGATDWQVFRVVVAPSAVTQILEGMRLAMGYSFMTVVPAEMLAAQSGLGYLIINSRLWLATDAIFVGIITLGCIGLAMDAIFRWIIYHVFRRYSAVA
jgi:NitT/TauT family transport system permease protein